MNPDRPIDAQVAEFALACERMNDFERALSRSGRFGAGFDRVTSGAGIRYYADGWRLEKWIEAILLGDQGLCAAWWLELGAHEQGWVIRSSVSVCPDEFSHYFQDRLARSHYELKAQLTTAVDELSQALERNELFANAVSMHEMAKNPAQ